MWKLTLLFTFLSSLALADNRPAMVFGNNNNALYLPTNKPLSGTSCLVVDPLGVVSPQTCGGGGGSGTVTSVGWGSTPSWLIGIGGPVTTSGTLGLAVPSQAANKFLASPNGSAGTMSPRSIVPSDVPTLNQNTTGSAGSFNTTFAGGLPLIGNGSGLPATASKTGTTTIFSTASGIWIAGHGVKIDASGNLVDTGVPMDQAAGPVRAVQYKGTLGEFKGDATFKFDDSIKALFVNDIYLAQGQDQPAGFNSSNRLEPWDRTGTQKVLVNTDGNPTQAGFCYVFDSSGNFVNSGASCVPVAANHVQVITADYTPTSAKTFILANCASTCTVSLPDISGVDSYEISMKNIGTAHAVFHNVVGQLIDGQNDWDLRPDLSHVNLISSGGQWYVY